ncbi:MAG: electron transport complex subunit E [Clostridiales bacterium]|nr:electron transport complex subunit E [Clostridiales bacterium]
MAEKKSLYQEFSKGIIKENPVLRLVLGTCPTLATTVSVTNSLGMGIAATIVLICSNIVISALRKIIPSKIRIPAYIVVIASFVTIVQMLVKAFVPALNDALGVYLPLIVVNCIILGRAEAFAGKNPVIASAVDGLGMGIGFTFALLIMSTIREVIGSGSFLDGIDSLTKVFGVTSFTGFHDILSQPVGILVMAPGGFLVFGFVMALANKIAQGKGEKKAELSGCSACPMAHACSLVNTDDSCDSKAKESENK